MRKVILYCLLIFSLFAISKQSYSQFLTQSAEGKSSIPLPLNGIGASFDITWKIPSY